MRKKQFTEAQIAFALRQAESGTSVAEIIRKMEILNHVLYMFQNDHSGSLPFQ